MTGGRTQAFSRGFMPLLPPQSEFGMKWQQLCAAHLEEGIRDPILVYEYLNRYYVQEGNKRVSVLKYFDAVEIPARVIRILPERDNDTERYFAFLSFSARSRVLQFELPGVQDYTRLQKAMGLQPDESWPGPLRSAFLTLWDNFRRLSVTETSPEHLLSLLELYGFETLKKASFQELKRLA